MKRLAAVILALSFSLAACQDALFSPQTGGAAFSAAPQTVLPQQSPIAIQTSTLAPLTKPWAKLKFDYSPVASVNLVNTGSPEEEATIRADLTSGAARLHVGSDHFDLIQFHWHTPSEHTVDGVAFPMEMHLVHRSLAGQLLVVGVLIADGVENRALAEIFRSLPEEEFEEHAIARVNLRQLLPQTDESYRYEGSLTTAPYAEGVRWVVLAQPIELSVLQITEFEALFPHGNSRHVQPLNGRTVSTDGGPGRSN